MMVMILFQRYRFLPLDGGRRCWLSTHVRAATGRFPKWIIFHLFTWLIRPCIIPAAKLCFIIADGIIVYGRFPFAWFPSADFPSFEWLVESCIATAGDCFLSDVGISCILFYSTICRVALADVLVMAYLSHLRQSLCSALVLSVQLCWKYALCFAHTMIAILQATWFAIELILHVIYDRFCYKERMFDPYGYFIGENDCLHGDEDDGCCSSSSIEIASSRTYATPHLADISVYKLPIRLGPAGTLLVRNSCPRASPMTAATNNDEDENAALFRLASCHVSFDPTIAIVTNIHTEYRRHPPSRKIGQMAPALTHEAALHTVIPTVHIPTILTANPQFPTGPRHTGAPLLRKRRASATDDTPRYRETIPLRITASASIGLSRVDRPLSLNGLLLDRLYTGHTLYQLRAKGHARFGRPTTQPISSQFAIFRHLYGRSSARKNWLGQFAMAQSLHVQHSAQQRAPGNQPPTSELPVITPFDGTGYALLPANKETSQPLAHPSPFLSKLDSVEEAVPWVADVCSVVTVKTHATTSEDDTDTLATALAKVSISPIDRLFGDPLLSTSPVPDDEVDSCLGVAFAHVSITPAETAAFTGDPRPAQSEYPDDSPERKRGHIKRHPSGSSDTSFERQQSKSHRRSKQSSKTQRKLDLCQARTTESGSDARADADTDSDAQINPTKQIGRPVASRALRTPISSSEHSSAADSPKAPCTPAVATSRVTRSPAVASSPKSAKSRKGKETAVDPVSDDDMPSPRYFPRSQARFLGRTTRPLRQGCGCADFFGSPGSPDYQETPDNLGSFAAQRQTIHTLPADNCRPLDPPPTRRIDPSQPDNHASHPPEPPITRIIPTVVQVICGPQQAAPNLAFGPTGTSHPLQPQPTPFSEPQPSVLPYAPPQTIDMFLQLVQQLLHLNSTLMPSRVPLQETQATKAVNDPIDSSMSFDHDMDDAPAQSVADPTAASETVNIDTDMQLDPVWVGPESVSLYMNHHILWIRWQLRLLKSRNNQCQAPPRVQDQ
ncbi:hypothetical protein DM01DRAFT_1056859 [Hesseltinella vesiculosa]|uniref:Uncharacterized protein n=1 Tax=Hesseltinella vesiculosa TaxID=101127 RepID=A0A1X2GFU3_9FUNG|nr:hypothetical protein DM01DRAFT_1056859 [Hesseltinella vesiculosa]